MTRARFTGQSLTKPEYDALDRAGLITRPLTDSNIGETTTGQRNIQAQHSHLHTHPDTTLGRRIAPSLPRTGDQGHKQPHPHIRRLNPAERPTTPTPDPRCGTDPGYSVHRRRNEPACTPCLAAHATYARNRKTPT